MRLLMNGRCISTSRKLITSNGGKHSLQLGGIISGALISIIKRVSVRPKYINAKVRFMISKTHVYKKFCSLVLHLGRH